MLKDKLNKITPRELVKKFVIWTVVIIIFLDFATSTFMLIDMNKTLSEELNERGLALSRHIAEESAGPLLNNDTEYLSLIAENVKETEIDVRYVYITDSEDNVVVHTSDNAHGINVSQPPAADNNAVTEFKAPISGGSLGFIHVGMDRTSINEKLTKTTQILIVNILIAGALGFLMANIAGNYLTRPIRSLVKGAQEIGRGNLGYKIELSSTDEEIQTLSNAFNQMSSSLNKSITELRTSEEKYRNLVESSMDIIYRSDREGNRVFMNNAGYRILEAEPEEMIGQPWTKWVHPEDREKTFKKFTETIENGNDIVGFESRYVSKSGKVINVLHNVRAIRNEKGEIIGTQGIARDITMRKRAEEALQHRIEMEKLIGGISTRFINLSPDEIDSNMNHTLQKIGEFANVDRSYVFIFYDNTTKMDIIHEWCAEGIEPQIQNLKRLSVDDLPWFARRIKELETVYVPSVIDLPSEAKAEKEHFQMQDIRSLIIVPMVFGRFPIGFIGFDSVKKERTWMEDDVMLLKMVGEIFVNALEHKRVEESLKLFSEAVAEAPDGIQIADLTGHIIYSNRAVEEIYGFSPAEFEGKHISEMNIDPEFVSRVILPSIKETGRWVGELMVKHKTGGTFPILLTTSTVKNNKGEPIAIIEIIKDITYLKEKEKLEMKLLQADKLATIGQLAAGIAHEINNPLGNISLYAQMLLKKTQDENIKGKLIVINDETNRAAHIVKGLLDFARQSEPKLSRIDINKKIDKVLSILNLQLKDIKVKTLLEPLPPVLADGGQIQQVIINLLTNSIQSIAQNGEIMIKTTSKQDHVEISIADNGCGIPRKNLDKIFDPFFTTKEQGKGTGLGLSVCYGIIKRHNGSVEVESEVGKGTTFTIKLPV